MARVSGCARWESPSGNRIELPQGFEGELYLRLHPDVARAGMHPAVHYHLYGEAEPAADSSLTRSVECVALD